MEAYEKSVRDVDVALRRLNATLESYRLASTTKLADQEASGSGAPATSASRKADQSAVPARSADSLAEPPKAVDNGTDTLREREQPNHDSIWREVLALRYVQSKTNRDSSLPTVSCH
jgi:hypothetical protein